jgi:uncharacterized integral membrane protein
MWFLKNLVWLVLMIAVIGFMFLNAAERVTAVHLPGTTYVQVPLFLVIFIAFVCGMLVAFVLTFVHYLKGQAAARKLAQQVRDLKQELSALRNLPLEDLRVEQRGEG